MNTPINYFWIGETLSKMELLTMHSCQKNGHKPVMWSFDNLKNLPDFVQIADAREIMSQRFFEYLRDQLRLPLASISDVFRYELLQKMGGCYSDTDVIILRNLDPILKKDFFCSTYEYGYGECASNCFMNLTAGSPVATYLVKNVHDRIRRFEANNGEEFNYCDFGPFLVQECARNMPISILSWDIINPISWRWVGEIIAFKLPNRKFEFKNYIRKFVPGIESRGYSVTKTTHAIHLCNEMWKQKMLNKDDTFHHSSLYQQLMEKYT